jgi:UTP-hexose-1-phosphate uridylyltransferase (EC 2.7.7.10)/UDP-glucose-hexose-1-phosphate uridylyltransferase (EC 2.7.7.12)
MAVVEIKKVVHAWQKEYQTLGKETHINYVQIFENKGAVMGCSNPHPHGQIWSQSTLPNEVLKKDIQQQNYFNKNNSSLLGDYLQQELALKERLIFENESVVVLTPFWAIWPFEVMIVPKKHQQSLSDLSEKNNCRFCRSYFCNYKSL